MQVERIWIAVTNGPAASGYASPPDLLPTLEQHE